MAKKSLVPIRILLISLVFPILIGASGCGKKRPPVAPESTTPTAITDLKAMVGEEAVMLCWTIPDRNTNGSKLADLRGFKIFRSEATFDSPGCPDCPKRFRELADIDYKGKLPENVSIRNNAVEFIDRELSNRTTYTYKVLSYNSGGVFSEDSNLVEVSWDISQLMDK